MHWPTSPSRRAVRIHFTYLGSLLLCMFGPARWLTISISDADTNGAPSGALLGCKLGFSGLPQAWLDGLVHGAWLMEQAERLCRLVGV